MTTRNLFKLIIAGALALGGPLQTQGHAAEIPPFDVYVVPPKPTTADELTLIATVDINGLFCGRALALGPFLPDAPEIDMFAVPLVPSASCPAVVEVRQLRFPLGRLDAGEHVVQVYLPLDDSFELETLLNFEVSETRPETPTPGG